jgi:hypothetical protein
VTARMLVTVSGGTATLVGRIDEAAAAVLAALPAQLPAGEITLDTGEVSFVNSVGLREWIRLIRTLRAQGRVTLVRLADVLIAQANVIPELATGVTIASFHAPYACDGCGAEASRLVDAIAHRAELAALTAPPLPCVECGAAMTLADFPERYLTVFSKITPMR